jgi:hypothetical protein
MRDEAWSFVDEAWETWHDAMFRALLPTETWHHAMFRLLPVTNHGSSRPTRPRRWVAVSIAPASCGA